MHEVDKSNNTFCIASGYMSSSLGGLYFISVPVHQIFSHISRMSEPVPVLKQVANNSTVRVVTMLGESCNRLTLQEMNEMRWVSSG